jgi:hypothetical protein
VSDWSNLAEDARARTGEPGPRCGVETFLNRLDGEDRRQIEAVLDDHGIASTGLRRTLREAWGSVAPGAWSISNHRAGKCRCGR